MGEFYKEAALDRHAALYGVERMENETDEQLRKRVVDTIYRLEEQGNAEEQPEVKEQKHMEKLSTIQKHNNLNNVFRTGDPGPGGAYHDYDIYPAQFNAHAFNPYNEVALACIEFQKGPRLDPQARHGVLDTDLLEIVRDRLHAFQDGPFACPENEKALQHIEEALLWMNKRVEDRAERNVLGTMQK